MLTKFKLKSLRKKQQKNVVGRDVSQINDKVHTVGVLSLGDFDASSETVKQLASSLSLEKGAVKHLEVLKFQKKLPDLVAHQMFDKQINWSGAIKNENAARFINEEQDVLVGLYNNENPYLDYLVSCSKAHFKIGFSGANEALFDLIIEVDVAQTKQVISEIKKYLTLLGKVS